MPAVTRNSAKKLGSENCKFKSTSHCLLRKPHFAKHVASKTDSNTIQRVLNNWLVDGANSRRSHIFRRDVHILESIAEENVEHENVENKILGAECDDSEMRSFAEDVEPITGQNKNATSAQQLTEHAQQSCESVCICREIAKDVFATVSETCTNPIEKQGSEFPAKSGSLDECQTTGNHKHITSHPDPPHRPAHLSSIFAQLDEVQCLFQSKLSQQDLLTIVTRFSAIKSDLCNLISLHDHTAARAIPSEILAHPSQPSTKTKKRRKPRNKNAAAAATPAVVPSLSASESHTPASSKTPTAQTELTSRGPHAASEPPHDMQQPHPQSFLDVARRSIIQPVAPAPQPSKTTPRSGVLVFRNADDQKKSISQIRDIMQQLNFKQGRDFTWVNSHGATFSLWGVHKTSIPRLKSVLATTTSGISLITNFDLRDKAQHTTRELSNKFKALYTDSLASRLQNDALLDLIRRRQKTSLEYLRNSSRNRNGALNQLVQLWQEAISQLTPSAAGASSAVATHA